MIYCGRRKSDIKIAQLCREVVDWNEGTIKASMTRNIGISSTTG